MGTVVHLTDQSIQLSARNWDSVYETVRSLSSNWEETESIVPLVTQYLSSNSVTLCSVTVTDLQVLSSFTVLGTATFLQTETLVINDPIVYVAQNNQTDLVDIGLAGAWTNPPGYPTGYQFGGLVRRADNKFWILFSGITAQPLSGINLSWAQSGINLEPLSANFYGDLFGNRSVFGSLDIKEGLTIVGNISGNNIRTSFNQGSATGNWSFTTGSGRAVGDYSTAENFNTTASGVWSHSEGHTATASGSASHAEGNSTTAVGDYSHAEGSLTIALGNTSHAEGLSSTAIGDFSHAEGLSARALGFSSHAEGRETTSAGDSSHAEGQGTTASGSSSHAEGLSALASGNYSHAEGGITQASGTYSHAEGDSTIASGGASHAEGTNTRASGPSSHAEGNETVASGNTSHAEGILTVARRVGSHAAGFRATANNNYSYIWSGDSTLTENISTTRTGQYMISAPGGVFIPGRVGIGTDIIDNALTVSGVIVAQGGNSDLWNAAYNIGTVYQNTSSNFISTTNLNAVSSLLTPLTLTNNLTSRLVTNFDFNNYQTSVAFSTATLLPITIYQNASGNWESTYNTVCALSSFWGSSLNVAAITNYLSSNSIILCSIDVKGQILSAGVNLFDIFVTSISGALQTLNYEESSYRLTIQGGNTVNLSSINTTFAANSGNWQSTYYTVCSLSAFWEESAEIIPTVSNYLSTNSILICALNVTQGISANTITATNVSATGSFFGRAQDDMLNILSTNTVQNSTIALAISSLNNALQIIVPAPTYNLPAATLTGMNAPRVFELGENVSRSLVLGFTQNDAGSPTQFEIFKNNISLLAQGLPFTQIINEPAALGTTTYRNTVTYNQGPVKNNILGLPDARDQIQAGTTSAIQTYDGYYRRWVGSSPTFLSNPNNVRTLSLSTSLDIDTNLNLASPAPIYINNKFIIIAIPNTRILTNVVTDVNEILTSQFNLSSVQIQDAAGVNRSYKLYYLETALPLNAFLINVTIANAP
jgi:hypothetical protein